MTLPADDTARAATIEAAPQRPALAGRRLAVRADGDAGIGTGHVMRCLALAGGWVTAGGSARLACTALPGSIAERYAEAGIAVERRGTWRPAELLGAADAVVLDLPGAEPGYGDPGRRAVLLTIDDIGDRPAYPGDVLLNQNAHATPALYQGKTTARLCLGPAWSLLRPEFAGHDRARHVPDRLARVLVLLGGADPHGHSARMLDAVAAAATTLRPSPEVVLVVGAANPALAALRRQAAGLPVRAEIQHDVRDMAALLGAADLAVSAAGSTVWEMAALGTPMILAAQNRSELGPAEALARHGAAVDLGPFEALDPRAVTATVAALASDPERRRAMSAAGRRLVDGRGVDRMLALLAELMAARQPV